MEQSHMDLRIKLYTLYLSIFALYPSQFHKILQTYLFNLSLPH